LTPLTDCIANGWSVSRGDAGALSWLITALYGLAAMACFADGRREGDRGLSRFWAPLEIGALAAVLANALWMLRRDRPQN
jgi:hypothetical protein